MGYTPSTRSSIHEPGRVGQENACLSLKVMFLTGWITVSEEMAHDKGLKRHENEALDGNDADIEVRCKHKNQIQRTQCKTYALISHTFIMRYNQRHHTSLSRIPYHSHSQTTPPPSFTSTSQPTPSHQRRHRRQNSQGPPHSLPPSPLKRLVNANGITGTI